MKLALINTPYLHTYGKISTSHSCSFPLGLGYMAAYVRQHGHSVKLFDPEAHRMPFGTMWEALETFKPDVIGFTSVTSNFMMAKELVTEAKRRFGCAVIMGGPHVAALPKSSLLGTPGLDAVILGEGEIPVLQLAQGFSQNGRIDFRQVESGAFFDGGEFVKTRHAPLIENIDSIPYPARDLVDMSVYRLHGHFQRGSRSATILSSRGCPSRCTFCGNFTMGRRFRPHSPEYFVGELEMLVKRYGIRHFHVVDDCFSYDPQRVERICDLILERKLGITWFIFGRVDTLQNERLLKRMRQAGCVYALLGIETGNQRINDIMRKGTTLEQAETCCRILRKTGIRYFNSFIIGNEGDTESTILETIRFAKKLKSVMAGFSLLIPFPGTWLFKKYFSDYDRPDTDWNAWCNVAQDIPYEPRQTTLSKADIFRLTALAYRRYYLNPSQWLRILAFVNNPKTILSFILGGWGLFRYVLTIGKKKFVPGRLSPAQPVPMV